MGHHHHSSTRILGIALAVTACFMVVELVGGLMTGSLALLADAGHMLSDAGALAVALFAARLAGRPPDARQTMGYQRAEVLGAALNAGALSVLAVWIAVEGMARISSPHPVAAGPMIAVATVGLVLNVGVAKMLHGDHDNINTRAAFLHVLGDLLGSVGAVAAGVVIWFGGPTQVDAVISIGIAVILFFGSFRVLRQVAGVLMQAAPSSIDVASIEHEIGLVEGVDSVHDLHVWTLRPGEDVLTVHVVVCDGHSAGEVCRRVRDRVALQLPGAHITVQPEPTSSTCSSPVQHHVHLH